MKRNVNFATASFLLLLFASSFLIERLVNSPHGEAYHWSTDLVMSHFSPRADEVSNSVRDKIALVYLTDETLSKFTYSSPADRDFLARLIRAIDEAGAKVIGLDFIFDRDTDPEKDQNLKDAIRNAKAQIVLGRVQGGTDSVPQSGYEHDFAEATGRKSGHLYFDEHHSSLTLSDEAIRRMCTTAAGSSKTPSFDEVVAVAYAGQAPTKLRGDLIRWLAPPKNADTFATLTADAIVDAQSGPPAVKQSINELLNGRIVLVGGDYSDRDQHLTPLSVLEDKRFPGLFIHAQILTQLIDGKSIVSLGEFWTIVAAFVCFGLGMIFGRIAGHVAERWHSTPPIFSSEVLKKIFELLAVLLLIGLGILAYCIGGCLMPFGALVFGWTLGSAASEVSHFAD